MGHHHRLYRFANLGGRVFEQESISHGRGPWPARGHGVDCAHVCEYADFMQRDSGRLDQLLPLFILLERTPRAYAFVLAGYTASLIGFPAVSDPGTVFNIAIIRLQEITIGIVCAALIHRYILPTRISGLFNSKLAQTLQATRQRIADTLAGKSNAQSEPLHLALALQFLQGVSHHIPYDFALSVPVRRAGKRSMTGWRG